MTKAILDVRGMSCQHCEHSVKTSLGSLAGVKDVQVELKTGKVEVEYDNTQIDLKEIRNTIEEQGFEVAE